MKRTSDPFLSEVEPVRRELDQWRRARTSKCQRIPERLWSQITRIARTFGVSRAARALGVQYYALKKRAGTGAPRQRQRRPLLNACQFVEVPFPSPPAPAGCTIELENHAGAKMVVRLPGAGAADAALLLEAFWRSRP